jgi:plasmid stabilization system protein ParE
MKTYDVILLDDAASDLKARYEYLVNEAGAAFASRYMSELESHLMSLSILPHIGHERSDLGTNVRVFGYRRHATIAIRVNLEHNQIWILAILFGGQSLEKRLS